LGPSFRDPTWRKTKYIQSEGNNRIWSARPGHNGRRQPRAGGKCETAGRDLWRPRQIRTSTDKCLTNTRRPRTQLEIFASLLSNEQFRGHCHHHHWHGCEYQNRTTHATARRRDHRRCVVMGEHQSHDQDRDHHEWRTPSSTTARSSPTWWRQSPKCVHCSPRSRDETGEPDGPGEPIDGRQNWTDTATAYRE
jgi:hypothetical protein